jgi:hypothetical protein
LLLSNPKFVEDHCMKFLYPVFLFALFAIIIPILIHLFSFRRFTTVYFSNVSYLKNIKNESQRKSRLKNLLILISRILAISALVFAFAQPYLPASRQYQPISDPVVSVYLDNSFSMNAISTEGQLLEAARKKGIEITEAYPPGTRYQLITNDMSLRHRHIFNKEQFIQQVSEIKTTSKSVPLSLIHNHLINNVRSTDNKASITAYYLSDFQIRTSDIQNFISDSTQQNFFLPLSSDVKTNLYIDSCWMEVPAHKIGQEEKLNVKIMNQSAEAFQNLPLKFYLDDTLKALGNFNIEPGKEQIVQLKYMNMHSGLHRGKTEITDYPFTYDNSYFLNYSVQPYLKALAIYGGSFGNTSGLPYLQALFDNDEYIFLETSDADNVQVSKLSSYNTIFLLNIKKISSGLTNEIVKAAENGSSVIFFPERDGDIKSYNDFLGLLNANQIIRSDTSVQKLAGIEWEHPVYNQVFTERNEDIDFPAINGHFVFTENTRIPEIPLLWYRNKAKALSTQTTGDGNLIVFSFPLSTQNSAFAHDLLFVPTIYSLVINSLPQQKISYTIGRESYATLSRQNIQDISSLYIANTDSNKEYIPEVTVSEGNRLKINFQDFFNAAGHYLVKSSGQTVAAVSMNYDRAESDMRFLSPAELTNQIEKYRIKNTSVIEIQTRNFSQVFDEIQHGKKLWKLFLLFALLFLAAEAMIIRFWK